MGNNKNIGVSQKAILFRGDGKFLTIRRSKTAPSRPLHWDLPGGDLNFGEDTKEGIIREIKEETGIKVHDLEVIDAISGSNDRREFWVTICYVTKSKTFEVRLSFEHDDLRWVTAEEFKHLKASPRNKKFIKRFDFLQKNKKLPW
jgi:8-oxo-dGTP diphosphatase